jgi:glutamine synthetase
MRIKTKLEYIWLDGYSPSNIRSKIKVVDKVGDLSLQDIPSWSFDGSSTKQADGSSSDCILKPVRVYKHHVRRNYYIVLCEVFTKDFFCVSKESPCVSNNRVKLRELSKELKTNDYWFAFEQEYFMYQNDQPLGWSDNMKPQGEYYCGVGTKNVSGRQLVKSHLDKCLDSGIGVTGVNAEVALGQWEYQIFGNNALKACDDLIVSRYMLEKEAEKFDIAINYHPKPVKGDWNGSGCHVNFSTKEMREVGGEDMLEGICEKLGEKHSEHMEVYGSHNAERLTGLHETQSIDKFSYGISDRGASIRIPIDVAKNNYTGYLEDRRPASNIDPYLVTSTIIETLK